LSGNPEGAFGRRMRKDRLTHSWSLDELSRRSGIHATYLSRIETGKRPPNERIANGADQAFATTWYTDWYTESRSWMPPGFRDWPELELKAPRLSLWSPGILDGLVQTEAYARVMFTILPGADDDAVTGRTKRRLERQRLLLMRENPPAIRLVIDELCLYRRVGSPDLMVAQLGRVAEIARMPQVIMQVHPAAAHPATASGFVLADDAAYVEHVLGGGVYTDEPSVASVRNLFDALRTECYGATESLLIIERAEELWTGERARIQARRAGRASKRATVPA
jgi:transcriptional regulator with XRE-family HTH domain